MGSTKFSRDQPSQVKPLTFTKGASFGLHLKPQPGFKNRHVQPSPNGVDLLGTLNPKRFSNAFSSPSRISSTCSAVVTNESWILTRHTSSLLCLSAKSAATVSITSRASSACKLTGTIDRSSFCNARITPFRTGKRKAYKTEEQREHRLVARVGGAVRHRVTTINSTGTLGLPILQV
jgi:hypothetical protein